MGKTSRPKNKKLAKVDVDDVVTATGDEPSAFIKFCKNNY